MRAFWTAAVAVSLAACASASGDDGLLPDAGDLPPPDAFSMLASECPPGQFATGLDGDGILVCAPIGATAVDTLSQQCSLTLAWIDRCDGCPAPPFKSGRVSAGACVVGEGADSTCSDTDLGGVSLPLFGLNTDGDVNDDDKIFVGMQCDAASDDPIAGPCPQGTFMTSLDGAATECVTGRGAIADYLRKNCQIYFGWRDNCDGCTDAPAKWGRVGTGSCTLGVGQDDTCGSFALGGGFVSTFGLNTDGDVNNDDKFYLGLECSGAEADTSTQAGACPRGQLVVGIDADGNVACASPLPEAEAAIQDDCFLYFGWRDSCDGCTTAPAKWGRVSHSTCENGAGADNTCTTASLDGTSVTLFGLNTDGDVDDNDKLYLGFACESAASATR